MLDWGGLSIAFNRAWLEFSGGAHGANWLGRYARRVDWGQRTETPERAVAHAARTVGGRIRYIGWAVRHHAARVRYLPALAGFGDALHHWSMRLVLYFSGGLHRSAFAVSAFPPRDGWLCR